MENEKLCWKCREILEGLIKGYEQQREHDAVSSIFGISFFLHCHHEPRKKSVECSVCSENNKIFYAPSLDKEFLLSSFCPRCGRRL